MNSTWLKIGRLGAVGGLVAEAVAGAAAVAAAVLEVDAGGTLDAWGTDW